MGRGPPAVAQPLALMLQARAGGYLVTAVGLAGRCWPLRWGCFATASMMGGKRVVKVTIITV